MLYFVYVSQNGLWHFTHETADLQNAVSIAEILLSGNHDRIQIIAAENLPEGQEVFQLPAAATIPAEASPSTRPARKRKKESVR